MANTKLEKIESVFRMIAVIIAAIWTFAIFEYDNVIVPSREPIAVSVNVDSKKIGEAGELTFFKLSVVLRNVSKVKVWVLSSCVNVYGYKIVDSEKGNTFRTYAPVIRNNEVESDNYAQYGKMQAYSNHFFQFSKLFSDTFKIMPGEQQSAYTVVAFPTKTFDVVHSEIDLIQSKEDAPLLVRWEKDDSTQAVSSYLLRVNGRDTSRMDWADNRTDTRDFGKKYELFSISFHNDYFTKGVRDSLK